jgi:protein KRI1
MERDEKEQEIKHLKNLQRQEMKAKLAQLAEVAGNGVDVDSLAAALEGDFDADEFSKRMEAAFAQAYSDADDDFDPRKEDVFAGLSSDSEPDVPGPATADSDSESSGSSLSEEEDARKPKKPKKDVKVISKTLQEVKSLADTVSKPASGFRFMYRKVKPNDYGLTADEILELEDSQLNRLVMCFLALRVWRQRGVSCHFALL